MPYIKKLQRVALDEAVMDALDIQAIGAELQDTGELNYAITSLILGYHRTHGGRYAQVNDVLGALEGAKLEFYRRAAAPYEDAKIRENGDVY